MKKINGEIEKDLRDGNSHKAYVKIKSLDNKQRAKSNVVKKKEGKLLFLIELFMDGARSP